MLKLQLLDQNQELIYSTSTDLLALKNRQGPFWYEICESTEAHRQCHEEGVVFTSPPL